MDTGHHHNVNHLLRTVFAVITTQKHGALQGTGGWRLLDDGSIHSVWWSIFNSMEKWLNNLLPHCSHFTQFSSERVPINIDQNCTKNPPTLTQELSRINKMIFKLEGCYTPKVSANQILLLQWCVSPLGCTYTGLGIDQNPSSPRHPYCHPRTDHHCCNCDTNFAILLLPTNVKAFISGWSVSASTVSFPPKSFNTWIRT